MILEIHQTKSKNCFLSEAELSSGQPTDCYAARVRYGPFLTTPEISCFAAINCRAWWPTRLGHAMLWYLTQGYLYEDTGVPI